jgi:hypothetical protein
LSNIFTITLDTLDNMLYTLDILDANIRHEADGGDHDKSIEGESESKSAAEPISLFCSPT